MIKSISISKDKAIIIDQTLLPSEEKYIEINNSDQMIEAIKKLRIRGAPAIGIAGMYACWLAFCEEKMNACNQKALLTKINAIEIARPTAVNLSYATDKARSYVNSHSFNWDNDQLYQMTDFLMDVELNNSQKMGQHGANLIYSGQRELRILTHCNTGSLATYGDGTALSVIRALAKKTKVKVWADETRPLMQGSRLTMWELMKDGIDCTLISDSMAAHTIKTQGIDLIITGADRIALNGDSANKIGTYNLSILAKHFNIPFYIVAPTTTIDYAIESGSSIVIEERDSKELIFVGTKQTAPANAKVFNPAFDVVDSSYIESIITEEGAFKYPYDFRK